jgi:hypothetical protein
MRFDRALALYRNWKGKGEQQAAARPPNAIDMRLRTMWDDEAALRSFTKQYPVLDPVQREELKEHFICPDCGAGTRPRNIKCVHTKSNEALAAASRLAALSLALRELRPHVILAARAADHSCGVGANPQAVNYCSGQLAAWSAAQTVLADIISEEFGDEALSEAFAGCKE